MVILKREITQTKTTTDISEIYQWFDTRSEEMAKVRVTMQTADTRAETFVNTPQL